MYKDLRKFQSATERVFRTAYFIAKENMAYLSLPKLVDLQKSNNCEMGLILHSETSCKSIVNFISSKMKSSLCNRLIDSNSKLSVLIDESSTISGKSCLIIHISFVLDNVPTVMFLELVELSKGDASSITTILLQTLDARGFSESFLKKNLICIACDGASVMLGSKSGVGLSIQKVIPEVIVWHCANHRLELAVDDAVNEVHGLNPFKIFIDSLYALYHPSPKNQAELKAIAVELECQLSKVGRVLDTRWAASSLRSLQAVWRSFATLAAHFERSSTCGTKTSKERSKFKGLHKVLTSVKFVQNIAIMLDALTEVSQLSNVLQTRGLSLMAANKLILQTIRAIELLKTDSSSCTHYSQVCFDDLADAFEFKGVTLNTSSAHILINREQFLQSLANNMRARLLTSSANRNEKDVMTAQHAQQYKKLLEQMELLNSHSWPLDYEEIAKFGEAEISDLATRFRVEIDETIEGFKVLKATNQPLSSNVKLQSLLSAINCIPVSTADCERGFSCMNNILTPSRNKLEVTNLSNLLFISSVGPSVRNFDPSSYAKAWLKEGRHGAFDSQSMQRKVCAVESYAHCHKYF